MKNFKTLKSLNEEFVKSLVGLGEVQIKIDDLYNYLKNDLKSLEIVLQEIKEDKSKFTKNSRKTTKIEEDETTRIIEKVEKINLDNFKNEIEKMKKLSNDNVKSLKLKEEEEIFMEFDR